MNHTDINRQDVKRANRCFYDAVADQYEEIDGRRSPAMEAWLRKNLLALKERTGPGNFLDLGAGSGLAARCAKGIFKTIVGLDLSPGLLIQNHHAFDLAVAADVDHLPFSDQSFDVITSFAVLHHLYDYERLVSECSRILRPGGIFYSDHDMDVSFYKRFRIPLTVYRKYNDACERYRQASVEVTRELYELTEYHENGVDTNRILSRFEEAGLQVEKKFHWYGLHPVTDTMFGTRGLKQGWAPVVSILATKAIV